MGRGTTRAQGLGWAAVGILPCVLGTTWLSGGELEDALEEARTGRHFLVVILEDGEAGVDADRGAEWRAAWTEALRPHLQVVVRADRRPSVASRFGATSFPQYIVVDGEGREVGRVQGHQVLSDLLVRLRRMLEAAERLPPEGRLPEASAGGIEGLYWAGTYRWNRGDRLQALQCFRRIVEVAEGLEGTEQAPSGPAGASLADLVAGALRRLAEDELDCGESQAAEAHFRRALSMGRGEEAKGDAAYGLAMSLRRQGRTLEAVKLLEEHLAVVGTSQATDILLFTLGTLRLELGDRKGARRHFAACADRFPQGVYGARSLRHLAGAPQTVAMTVTGTSGSPAGIVRRPREALD